MRLVAVDDAPVSRCVALTLIEATRGFASVGEATSGDEAVELSRSVWPDLGEPRARPSTIARRRPP